MKLEGDKSLLAAIKEMAANRHYGGKKVLWRQKGVMATNRQLWRQKGIMAAKRCYGDKQAIMAANRYLFIAATNIFSS